MSITFLNPNICISVNIINPTSISGNLYNSTLIVNNQEIKGSINGKIIGREAVNVVVDNWKNIQDVSHIFTILLKILTT